MHCTVAAGGLRICLTQRGHSFQKATASRKPRLACPLLKSLAWCHAPVLSSIVVSSVNVGTFRFGFSDVKTPF